MPFLFVFLVFCVAIPHAAPVDNTPAEKPSFEEAIAQLERIVDSMESGDVPLAELLAKFESGTQLLQACEARLKDAELRIEQLKKNGKLPSLSGFETAKDGA